MKAYMFAGQGSQYKGMGEGLFDDHEELIAMADSVLGYSVQDLCLNDQNRELNKTKFTQPALYLVNTLIYKNKISQGAKSADYLLGHSLGEYNALLFSEVFDFKTGLEIVKKRGELMSTVTDGAMAAILGLDEPTISKGLAECGLNNDVQIANYNSPSQYVISGRRDAVMGLKQYLESKGGEFIPLNTSGAFHSKYMAPLQDEFREFLNQYTFNEPKVPVVANINALPYEKDNIVENMVQQIAGPVRWIEGLSYIKRMGVDEFEEIGPKDILQKLLVANQGKQIEYVTKESQIKDDGEYEKNGDSNSNNGEVESLVLNIKEWNEMYPIGTKMKFKNTNEILETRTKATILFGHRAAVYMDGYRGYFSLDDLSPAQG